MGVVGGATVVGGARARKVALDLADSRFHLFRMMMKSNHPKMIMTYKLLETRRIRIASK